MSKRRILAGISFSWLRFVLSFLVVFFQTPLYFKHLPKESVGIWFLFFSIASFLQMSDFGLPSAMSRAIAYIKNENKKSEQQEVLFYTNYSVTDIFKSSFISFFIVSLVVTSGGCSIALLLNSKFDALLSDEVSIAFTLFLIGVFFNMIANVPNACLSGLGDVGIDNLSRIIVQLLGFSLVCFILPIRPLLSTLSCIYLIQSTFSICLSYWFLKKRHNKIFERKGNFDIYIVKRLYKESFPLFVNQVGGWLTNQSGIWIATFILGASVIADYSILIQLAFYGLGISMAIPTAVNPYAISAFSSEGVKGVYKYFYLTLKGSTFIVGFWIIVLINWGNVILEVWIGKGHFLGYAVLTPILINLFLEMQHGINGGFVWNTGKWPFVSTTVLAGILNVLFGIFGCYNYGFIGLAIGTMLAKLLTLNWYVVSYALNRLQIHIMPYCKEYLMPVITVIIITIFCGRVIKHLLATLYFDFTFRGVSGIEIINLSIGIFLLLCIWTLLYYTVATNLNEKLLLNSIFRKLYGGKKD